MNIENEIEVWKDVPEYEGLYQVSSFGRVKSITRYGTKGGFLSQCKDRRGYLLVKLYKNNESKNYSVHALVAITFLGHIQCGHEIVVDHINNIKTDNRLINLRLTNNRENCSKDRKGSNNFTGVSWDKSTGNWVAHIVFKGRQIHLGSFKVEIDAKNAYDKALEEWKQGLDLNIIYPKKINSSQYLGVYWDKNRNKWVADYMDKYLGRYDTELEAHQAVQNYIESLNLKV